MEGKESSEVESEIGKREQQDGDSEIEVNESSEILGSGRREREVEAPE